MNRCRNASAKSRHRLICLELMLILCVLAADGPDDLASRRQYVLDLSAQSKNRLLEKRDRFEALDETEQQRLRELHARINREADGDRLETVLRNYHQWLSLLPSRERAEILDLPLEKRLDEIEKRVKDDERKRFLEISDQHLTPDDLEAIHLWLRKLIARHEEKILARMSALKQIPAEPRYRMFLYWIASDRNPRTNRPSPFQPTPDETGALIKSLGPKAHEFLEKLETPQDKHDVLWTWIRTAVQTRLFRPAETAKLITFMESLPPEQRNRLEALPRKRMLMELQRLFMRHNSHSDAKGRMGPRRGEQMPPGDRRKRPPLDGPSNGKLLDQPPSKEALK